MPRRNQRIDLDFYVTPHWQTDILMREGLARALQDDYDRPPVLVEPCVGEGHIIRAIAPWVPDAQWSTNDLDPRHVADSHLDAGTDEFWGGYSRDIERPDWVISNPPFSDAVRIIPRAYDAARVGIAMLLRVTWLEPCEDRKVWLASHPPTWELVMERYSYRQNGSQDSATAAWFVWVKDPNAGPQRIVVVPGRGVQPALGEMAL
jgi:hypothetical protein